MKTEDKSTFENNLVKCLNDPYSSFQRFTESIQHCNMTAEIRESCFVLCNASTQASEHEGISAAGADPQSRRLTPALDAEGLVLGKTISSAKLPVSPKGIVSPVVISRACLHLLGLPIKVIDCGSFLSPQLDAIRLSDRVADCPSSGRSMDIEHVKSLFKSGSEIAKELVVYNKYLVIAECVPGGTSTALGVLSALGHSVDGFLSSSLPVSNHDLRSALVKKGLMNSPYVDEQMMTDSLLAVASMGDPMQAVVAGMASEASRSIPVILAGGSQMLAVWAVLKALAIPSRVKETNIFVMSTSWVAFDPSAQVQVLAKMLNAPFAVSSLDFNLSRHEGLQAYEKGNVKEGVGAGACMCIASMSGFSQAEIMNAIDDCYDNLVTI